jgi:hypothetical protein
MRDNGATDHSVHTSGGGASFRSLPLPGGHEAGLPMKIVSLLAGLLLTGAGPSFAGPPLWSGAQLLQYYRAYESTASSGGKSGDVASFGLYIGYIRGAYEIQAVSPDTVCIDNHVTLKQIGDVVGRYMMDNPRQLELPAVFLVRKSLKDAFPCN